MTYPYILPPLPYAPAALEPNLGRSSVRLHHDAFFAAYVDRLNGALVPWTQYQDWPLERLLLHWCQLPRTLGQAVRRYGGGVYNHGLYFSSLAPARTAKPSGELLAEVEHSFGSMEGLHRSLKNAAMSVFGSGWVWLVCCSGGLQVTCTANQDTPLHGCAAAFDCSVDENRNGSGISPRSPLLPRHPHPYHAAYRRCRSGRC